MAQNSDLNDLLISRAVVEFANPGSHEPDIEFQLLLEEPFVAACRRDHPLARRRAT